MAYIRQTDRAIGGGIYLAGTCLINKQYRNKALDVAKMVNRSVDLFRKHLDFPKDLLIRIAPIKGTANGRYYDNGLVEIDCRLSPIKALEVFAHELVHAEQYKQGRLRKIFVMGKGWAHKWHGSLSYNKGTTYQAYLNQPWEKEAFGRERELAMKIYNEMDKIYGE